MRNKKGEPAAPRNLELDPYYGVLVFAAPLNLLIQGMP